MTVRCLICFVFLCAVSVLGTPSVIPEDARWDHRFSLPGVQGNVMGVAFDKRKTYVGGSLESVGATLVDGIASIEDRRVTALPDGPRQNPALLNVTDLKMFQGKLCVAGMFTNIGSQAAGGFGVWHGNGWDPVEITNGYVYSIEPEGSGGLLTAGRFQLPGGSNPVALARWDGKGHWEHLNSELPPCDDKICIEAAYQPQPLADGNVIVTLQLKVNTTPPQSFPSYLLALCDAQKNWHNLPGPDGDSKGRGFYNLGTFRGQAVAGGSFSNAANPQIKNIAIWDGSAWQPIGGGVEHEVFAVAGNAQVLYAATYFTSSDGFPKTRILCWEGTEWRRVGEENFSADSSGRLYLGPKGELYYSGFFTGVGTVVSPNLIRWDGKRWEPVVEGRHQGVYDRVPNVFSIVEHASNVFIGGQISTAGNTISQGIVCWDGRQWHSVGGGIVTDSPTHGIRCMASTGPELLVGGVFTNIGGVSCSNAARWDGSSWRPLGAGINGTVAALTIHHAQVIAGGRFTRAGTVAANNIASWDGAQWQPLGAGCSSNVAALVSWRGDLYAGGIFETADGAIAPRIAKWNGLSWQGIGTISGRRSAVNALAATPGALYVGGSFTNAGGRPVQNLACWDGTNWQSVGSGWPGTVFAIAHRGNDLFVGGTWTNSSGKTIHAVRKWDGTNWLSLGSGIADARGNQRAVALLAKPDALWAGGRFAWAGGKPSANIARWIETPQLGLLVRRGEKSGKNDKAGTLEFHVDPGMRGHLETSTDLLNWIRVSVAHDSDSDWQADAPDEPGKWFYRFAIEQ